MWSIEVSSVEPYQSWVKILMMRTAKVLGLKRPGSSEVIGEELVSTAFLRVLKNAKVVTGSVPTS